MSLDLNLNGEGDPLALDRASLSATFADSTLGAYGEVLEGILTGDATLSVRGDVAEECWRVVTPVLHAWHRMPCRSKTIRRDRPVRGRGGRCRGP